MRTVILKPFLILTLILSVTFISINAGQLNNGGQIFIELHQGFTIEDIIQDLHDNANIDVNSNKVSTTTHMLKYDKRVIDDATLYQFLEVHPGCDIVPFEK